jgi:hypothetical protein
MTKARIKVRGVRRKQLTPEDLTVAFWLQAKAIVRDRREQEAKAAAKRQGRPDGK